MPSGSTSGARPFTERAGEPSATGGPKPVVSVPEAAIGAAYEAWAATRAIVQPSSARPSGAMVARSRTFVWSTGGRGRGPVRHSP